MILIQVLGQIDKPLATEVLAMMSVFGRTAEVRRRAAEVLRGRPAGDYLELLVGLMIDPLKYEVKPVGGPGSPGILLVEGQQFNVARFYVPPSPYLPVSPGLVGSQVIKESTKISRTTKGAVITDTSTVRDEFASYSMADILMEQQKAAAVAEYQLEGDLSVIKVINAERRRFNDIVTAALSYATGKDVGPSPKDWRDAVAAKQNSRKIPAEPSVKPTFTEMIPVMYNPVVLPRLSFMTSTTSRSYVDT